MAIQRVFRGIYVTLTVTRTARTRRVPSAPKQEEEDEYWIRKSQIAVVICIRSINPDYSSPHSRLPFDERFDVDADSRNDLFDTRAVIA